MIAAFRLPVGADDKAVDMSPPLFSFGKTVFVRQVFPSVPVRAPARRVGIAINRSRSALVGLACSPARPVSAVPFRRSSRVDDAPSR
jgi:hypothetical protein